MSDWKVCPTHGREYLYDGCPVCERERADEEVDALRMVARMRWNASEWLDIGAFDERETYDQDANVRGSVREMPGSNARMESGEDLPGSWHQQSNGGSRHWTTAAGEIG